jgi:hypothetical protein
MPLVCGRRAGWKGAPVEVEGPERHNGQHLDLAELDRRAAQHVVYHGGGLLPYGLSFKASSTCSMGTYIDEPARDEECSMKSASARRANSKQQAKSAVAHTLPCL